MIYPPNTASFTPLCHVSYSPCLFSQISVAGTCAGSCIHPFIQMRLKHMGNPTLFSKKNGEANGNGELSVPFLVCDGYMLTKY